MSTTPYILVCDDEAHIRQIIAHKLRGAGFEVIEAKDGQEGLEQATARTPRLVITDFQMPRLSGLDMCKALKKHASTSRVSALMLTARGHTIAPADLEQTNVRQVIGKPFGVKQLMERVDALLRDTPAQGVAA
ncbi:MAG: response regulator [Phycisphaerales bacterium]|nr:response regulator [Phycisphaerales bacterium]